MEVYCGVCGAPATIHKWEEDYEEFRTNPEVQYICEVCKTLIEVQSRDEADPFFAV